MKRTVLDTNVVLSFLIDRDPEQQAAAARLFQEAAAGERTLILHQAVITEMVYVLRNLYKVEKARIAEILADLLALPGILPVDEVAWSLLLDLWPESVSDFTDAVLAAVTLQHRYDGVATFDRPFAGQLKKRGVPASW
jgi:predicted nucleic acid-binding protein